MLLARTHHISVSEQSIPVRVGKPRKHQDAVSNFWRDCTKSRKKLFVQPFGLVLLKQKIACRNPFQNVCKYHVELWGQLKQSLKTCYKQEPRVSQEFG